MGAAKPPAVLPVGDYTGIIRTHEIVAAQEGKDYENIIRFHGTYVDWPESVEEEDRMQETAEGLRQIELAKRRWRRDFYDHRLDQLDDFLKSCGVEPGRSYSESLPEVHGVQVVVETSQYINQRTGELGNQVNNIRGIVG